MSLTEKLHQSLRNPSAHPSQNAAKVVAGKIKAMNKPEPKKPKPNKPKTGAKKVSTTKAPLNNNQQSRPIVKHITNNTTHYNFRDKGSVVHGGTSPTSDRTPKTKAKPKVKSAINSEFDLMAHIKMLREWDSMNAPQSVVSRIKTNPEGGNTTTTTRVAKRMVPKSAYRNNGNIKKKAKDGIVETKENPMQEELEQYIKELIIEGFSDEEILHMVKEMNDNIKSLSRMDVIKAARTAANSKPDGKKAPAKTKPDTNVIKNSVASFKKSAANEQKDLSTAGTLQVESTHVLHQNMLEALKAVNTKE